MKALAMGTAVVLAAMAWNSPAADPSPAEILREADKARGNPAGASWSVTLLAVENNRTNSMSFHVRAREHNFLAEALSPPRRKGNKLLFRDGKMWFCKPDLSKPAPISQRQKLLGKASLGDIASTSYSRDYDAGSLPDEMIDGEECYVLDLHTTTNRTTYKRIVYWVSKRRLVGVKADYYTVSGRKVKSAVMEYAHQVPTGDGGKRPFCSKVAITDEIRPSNKTTLTISAPVLEPVPDSVFDLNLLAK